MMNERNQEMMDIMEEGNYEAFKAFTPFKEEMIERHNSITEEQFNKMVEAYNLRKDGKFLEAREIMEELGFDNMHKRHGKRGGNMMNAEHRQEMEEIMENEDFEAFKALTPQNKEMAERHNNITEEQFNKMVEAHNLREDGDFTGAREIMEELGFGRMHNSMKGGNFQGRMNR